MKDKILTYLEGISLDKGAVVDEKTDLFESGVLDSLGIISMLSFLQQEFKVSFSPDNLKFENFQSVDKIVDWLNSVKG